MVPKRLEMSQPEMEDRHFPTQHQAELPYYSVDSMDLGFQFNETIADNMLELELPAPLLVDMEPSVPMQARSLNPLSQIHYSQTTMPFLKLLWKVLPYLAVTWTQCSISMIPICRNVCAVSSLDANVVMQARLTLTYETSTMEYGRFEMSSPEIKLEAGSIQDIPHITTLPRHS